MAEYPYARGNLMDQPNTYFYTGFEGEPFLGAWRHARQVALDALPAPAVSAPAFDLSASGTAALLETAYQESNTASISGNGLPFHAEAVLRKFEAGKRIYDAYDRDLRPLDRQQYRTAAFYVRAGEIFEAAYVRTADIRAVNALLKCLDTLTAHIGDVDAELRARLSRLILQEREFVMCIAARKGVRIP